MKMGMMVALIGVICMVLACSAKKKADTALKNVRFVGAQEFQSLLNARDPNMVLLDVRTPQEFAEGHIAGATNIDFYERDFNNRLAALDRTKTYLIYCRSGNRTRSAAAQAASLGLTAVVLERGIIDWQANQLPLEK